MTGSLVGEQGQLLGKQSDRTLGLGAGVALLPALQRWAGLATRVLDAARSRGEVEPEPLFAADSVRSSQQRLPSASGQLFARLKQEARHRFDVGGDLLGTARQGAVGELGRHRDDQTGCSGGQGFLDAQGDHSRIGDAEISQGLEGGHHAGNRAEEAEQRRGSGSGR